MIELEDIVPRRDYKLKVDWNCSECPKDFQGKRVQICGIILPGEFASDQKQISWDDLFHIKCLNNHITRPERYCTKCGNRVPYEAHNCPPCERRIIDMLLFEEQIETIKEDIRLLKRTKADYTEELNRINQIKQQLISLKFHPCEECGKWINEDQRICNDCGRQELS